MDIDRRRLAAALPRLRRSVATRTCLHRSRHMTNELSPNTKAILLLTAPLIAGRGKVSTEPLSAGEYKRLARRLRECRRQPSDLLGPGADEVLKECRLDLDGTRVERLLKRGFLLSHAVERWQARAIWVVSRADTE